MIEQNTVLEARGLPALRKPWIIASSMLIAILAAMPAIGRSIDIHVFGNIAVAQKLVPGRILLGVCLLSFQNFLCFGIGAGMFAFALREWRGEEPTTRDLTLVALRYVDILLMAIAVAVFEEAVWALVVTYMNNVAGTFLIQLVIAIAAVPFIFTLPFWVDQGHSVFKAARLSVSLVARQPLAASWLLVSAKFWANLGYIALVVGAVWSLPTYPRAVAKAYLDCLTEAD